jgi:hypothetical protein
MHINQLQSFAFSIHRTREKPRSTLHMKKQILLLTSIIISTQIIAQTAPSFGIRGGLSSATMQGEAVNSLKNLLDYTNGRVTTSGHTGYFAGGYATIPLGNNFSLEPAVYYTQKGYELKGNLTIKGMEFLSANAKAQLTSHYIDLPLLLKANIGGLQLFAGPQISYLAKADLRTTAGVLGFNLLNRKTDATDQFNRWDAGITGGLGYQFTRNINIMAAYDYGLAKADAGKNTNAYNRSFKVGLGFSF